MNTTKIEWCDLTWNPVTGCLGPNGKVCEYCYARNRVRRFQGHTHDGETIITSPSIGPTVLSHPLTIVSQYGVPRKAAFPFGFHPTLHEYRLGEPARSQPKDIFVCSMADLFGDWVPDEWIEKVFAACRMAPWHRYLFLTKNPRRYCKLLEKGRLPLDKNMWYGTTVTNHQDCSRAKELCILSPHHPNTFLSLEPLLELVKFAMLPEWLILGGETGNRKGKVRPEQSWLEYYADVCRSVGTSVFMKNSLADIWGEKLIRELPWKG